MQEVRLLTPNASSIGMVVKTSLPPGPIRVVEDCSIEKRFLASMNNVVRI